MCTLSRDAHSDPSNKVKHQRGRQESFSLRYLMPNVTFRRASLVAQGACQPLQETRISISGLGRSLGEGNGNLRQYSCLGNLMDRGAWWATVHGVAKSRTQLSDFTSLHFTSSRAADLQIYNGSDLAPIIEQSQRSQMHQQVVIQEIKLL